MTALDFFLKLKKKLKEEKKLKQELSMPYLSSTLLNKLYEYQETLKTEK